MCILQARFVSSILYPLYAIIIWYLIASEELETTEQDTQNPLFREGLCVFVRESERLDLNQRPLDPQSE